MLLEGDEEFLSRIDAILASSALIEKLQEILASILKRWDATAKMLRLAQVLLIGLIKTVHKFNVNGTVVDMH